MRDQQGAITLLITALLLVAILVLSLASYKNVFFQAKRAQNEVIARQNHWAAEGGLECAFANIQDLKIVPSNFNNCSNWGPVSVNAILGTPLILNAKSGHVNIKKAVKMPTERGSGAIQSSANLYLYGSFSFFPDPGQASTDPDEWQCMAIRYKNIFGLFGTMVNSQFDVSNPPYIGFPSSQSCSSDHYTSSTNSALATKDDFFQDVDLEPFEDLFGTPRSDWMDIMYDESFTRIPSSLGNKKPSAGVLPIASQYISNCADQIVNKINSGKDLIWIYGSCELANDGTSRNDLDKIEIAIDSNSTIDGVVLVIQDGIFSVKGAHEFPGMIYHFESTPTAFTPSSMIWNTMLSYQGNPTPFIVGSIPLDKTMYYQSGAFVPLGGYVMDTPGKYAVFGSSMQFRYNRDVVENALKKLRKIEWIKGSWHDF
ncbi:hypothetical protein HC725_00860 [Vibrio sp. S17_S38]|uniref:hypothetical protein n=1 Tax=Vibrio sp. S17_S38 TaxID=2720229 RepID=UPI001681BA24|nr:hypothetical protein [Vibrio sp. S17_S38]MBD1571829.1 hypothetical protein [Vibrio sp. S17_S38]